MTAVSIEDMEIDLDADLHGHRLAVLARGIEAPAVHGFKRFLVESHAERAGYAKARGPAVRRYDGGDDYYSLQPDLARFIGVVGLRFVDHARRANAISRGVDSVTATAARARTPSRTVPDAVSTTFVLADSAMHPRARRGYQKTRQRITQLANLRKIQIRRAHNRGFNLQYRPHLRQHDGRSQLLAREAWSRSLGGMDLIGSAAATSAVRLTERGWRNVGIKACDTGDGQGSNPLRAFHYDQTHAHEKQQSRVEREGRGEVDRANRVEARGFAE